MLSLNTAYEGDAEVIDGYTANLDAGTIHFDDVAGYPASVKVVAREEVYRQIAEVRIDGSVRLTQPIGKAFDVGAVFRNLSLPRRSGFRQALVAFDAFRRAGR